MNIPSQKQNYLFQAVGNKFIIASRKYTSEIKMANQYGLRCRNQSIKCNSQALLWRKKSVNQLTCRLNPVLNLQRPVDLQIRQRQSPADSAPPTHFWCYRILKILFQFRIWMRLCQGYLRTPCRRGPIRDIATSEKRRKYHALKKRRHIGLRRWTPQHFTVMIDGNRVLTFKFCKLNRNLINTIKQLFN